MKTADAASLIKRYDRPGPRYTSYPTAVQFDERFDEPAYRHRLELLGGTPSPLAEVAVRRAWMFPPMAALAVVIELVAPIALFGGWYRNVWVGAAWLMHAGIAALMLIAFPYPLFLMAFAPFFPLERVVRSVGNLVPSGPDPEGTRFTRRWRGGGERRSPG